ncbi:MAG TPA: hypothetical protein VJL29_09585, partial [Thermoguttaceae bacterium]|nr:hypothetical protein [Thermoguttaceae bacterium]
MAAIAVVAAGWWSGPAAAQQIYPAPDAVMQFNNLPERSEWSNHFAARCRADGYLYLWDGTGVWRQDGVNVNGFTLIGQVSGVPDDSGVPGSSGVNMADAGPINFSRDDQRILLGNGAGGWGPLEYPPQEWHAGRIFSMAVAGETASSPIADIDYHYDFIPVSPRSTIDDADRKYFVDYGSADYETNPGSWVAVLDENTGDATVVIEGIPDASAAIATDNKGNLFACVGHGAWRGLIKWFARAEVDQAYATDTPLAWVDGVALNPNNYDNHSGAGMFSDARGYLFAGGNEGVTVFRPDGTSGTFNVLGGYNASYASVIYNPLEDQVLVMFHDWVAGTMIDVYEAADFLSDAPGDANGDGAVN